MFKRLFKKFIAQPARNTILKSNLADEQQICKGVVDAPVEITMIDVPHGQTCLLCQEDSDSILLTLSGGTHEVSQMPGNESIDPEMALHYFYLAEKDCCDGEWTLDYKDHHQKTLTLSGVYSVQIDNPQRLVQCCIKTGNFHNDADFTYWISQSIATILKTQRIPAEDIHAENVRFANFLRDALTLAMRPRGLVLRSLSLNIVNNPAQNIPADKPVKTDTTEQPGPSAPETQQENTEPSIEPVIAQEDVQPEKLFYYVRNGQQHGPFSHDDIKQMLADGTLRQHDLLWQKGLTSWKTISEFSGFRTRS